MSNLPTISIIIPARNAERTLGQTLHSIVEQSDAPDEIIIIDDGSVTPVDTLDPVKTRPDIRLIHLDKSRGPAVARNAGAAIARSDVILFIDSDVVLDGNAVQRIRRVFRDSPDVSAVQGIYSHRLPDGFNICSRYQNHYYHFAFKSITADTTAVCATFCFAVKRAVFDAMGGFNAKIKRPTVEDEAFGYTLTAEGHNIVLQRDVQVTHLASYTLDQLILRKFRMSFHQVKSAIRGIRPPVRNIHHENKTHHAGDTLAAVLLAPLLPIAWLWAWPAGILWLIAYTAANARFWSYLTAEEPPFFAGEIMVLTWIDQVSIACGLVFGTLDYALGHRY